MRKQRDTILMRARRAHTPPKVPTPIHTPFTLRRRRLAPKPATDSLLLTVTVGDWDADTLPVRVTPMLAVMLGVTLPVSVEVAVPEHVDDPVTVKENVLETDGERDSEDVNVTLVVRVAVPLALPLSEGLTL